MTPIAASSAPSSTAPLAVGARAAVVNSGPWWKFGHVWLVIAGPAVVIVAGFVTLWIAVSRPDPVVAEDYYQKGMEINKTLQDPSKSLAPALKARNHAATPTQDQPR